MYGKHWCFTLNNPAQADEDRLQGPLTDVEYIVYGREVGEQGTPHLQGYVVFSARKRITQVTAIIGQAHCTLTRDRAASITYCKKDGNFFEAGTPPCPPQGKRSDIDLFKEAVQGGMLDMNELMENHSAVYAKMRRFVFEYVELHTELPQIEAFPLRLWQQTLNGMLNLPADDRKIIFVVDVVGNTGKSWFCRYYESLHANVQVILPGKKADMALVLVSTSRVLFMDAPRSKQGEYIQYDFLEDVKNGYVFSSKYESRNKRMAAKAHVVVMMNEEPDMTKLSADRYEIIHATRE